MEKAIRSESLTRSQLYLHSDIGGPMKGSRMLAKLPELGVVASFSRPAMSNDSVYESAKVRHPERWGSRAARSWKRVERVHLNPSVETLVQVGREQAA